MDPNEQPGPDLPGGDAAPVDLDGVRDVVDRGPDAVPVDVDALEPVRDLLDTDPDGLFAQPADPMSQVDGDLGAVVPIIEGLAPPGLDPVGPADEPAPPAEHRVDGPDHEAISLDLDRGRSDAPSQAPAPDAPPPPAAVDLSLDADVMGATEPPPGEPPPEVADPAPAVEEVILPLTDPGGFDVPFAEGNGSLSPGLVAAAVAVVGASAHALRRLRRPTPPDLAAHLDALGIDARVQHLDLVGLEELLARGATVLLSTDGSAGVDAASVLQLRAVDHPGGQLHVLDEAGVRRTVPLASFEEAWADSAHQVVEARGAGGDVALVPVVLRHEDLVARP